MFGGGGWGAGYMSFRESCRSIPLPVISRVKYNETDTILFQSFIFINFLFLKVLVYANIRDQ